MMTKRIYILRATFAVMAFGEGVVLDLKLGGYTMYYDRSEWRYNEFIYNTIFDIQTYIVLYILARLILRVRHSDRVPANKALHHDAYHPHLRASPLPL